MNKDKIEWGRKINPRLEEVISYCKKDKIALDLGCGIGANSLYLIERGFEVTCVESNSVLIEKLKSKVINMPKSILANVKLIQKDILEFIPDRKYNLVLALFVLHFFQLEDVKKIINRIQKSLVQDGVLYMSVFSNEDDNYSQLCNKGLQINKNEIYSQKLKKTMHFFDKSEIEQLLSRFNISDIREYKKEDNHPPDGKHIHKIIEAIAARK